MVGLTSTTKHINVVNIGRLLAKYFIKSINVAVGVLKNCAWNVIVVYFNTIRSWGLQ